MLVLWIAVELDAVDTIGVAIVRSVTLLQFHHFLPLDLIVESDDGLAPCSDELGPIE
jgi:hypothetical protein